MTTQMVEVRNLVKRFGSFTAVNDVSFSVGGGEVLGFLGPNGAGKSTTMKMITGFLAPTSGSISVAGHDVDSKPIAAKKSIGYLAEGAPAYPDMTPVAFLEFVARVRGFSGSAIKQRVDAAIEKANLRSVAYKDIDTLSKGFKRRVGIAQAILHDPPVLIMDEPTDGLDPNQKHEMRRLIAEMAKDKAIVVSTHILEEVNALCTRAIIIARGKLLFDGTPRELEQRSSFYNAVRIVTAANNAAEWASALGVARNVARVDTVPTRDGRTRLTVIPVRGAAIIGEISQLMRDRDWSAEEISVESGRLDEVFRSITTSTGAEVLS